MNSGKLYKAVLSVMLSGITAVAFAQQATTNSVIQQTQKAAHKLESGVKKNNSDTLAQGYFELGESYFNSGDLAKSETWYKKAKEEFEKIKDAAGIAKSSRALAIVQEGLNKKPEALINYNTAQVNNINAGDNSAKILNGNDIRRLSMPDTSKIAEKLLLENIKEGEKNRDTLELINSYGKLGTFNSNVGNTNTSVQYLNNAFVLSKNTPVQAVQFSQQITDVYLKDKNFEKAVETKKNLLNEPFVINSTQLQAQEINSLADIYIKKQQADSALQLLKESYSISVKNGHTLEAKKCIEKLDSIYRSSGNRELSLALYKDFLTQLPAVIDKDSSLIDNRIIEETEQRIQALETEKKLKDDLIRRKNVFNYSLLGSLLVLLCFATAIFFMYKKMQVKNKKIALQSLRREMNPHFIFNSLNSINQFIANNNELEANRYLTRFSTLMRRVMENSKHDFVLLPKETELLQHYLELEKTRFPDKFDFTIHMDEELNEQLFIPGMLIQPHLENAIWHGLRHIEGKGMVNLSFAKKENSVEIIIEDNGIGIEESKKIKTENQKKHQGRGIENMQERIKILNELYHKNITCTVTDKQPPEHGVSVKITVPIIKEMENNED